MSKKQVINLVWPYYCALQVGCQSALPAILHNSSSIILIGKARIMGIIGLLSGNFASYLHKIPQNKQLFISSCFSNHY